jgi:hypothetical protein
MNSDARVNKVVLPGDLNGAIECARAVAGADAKNVGDSFLVSADDDLVAI